MLRKDARLLAAARVDPRRCDPRRDDGRFRQEWGGDDGGSRRDGTPVVIEAHSIPHTRKTGGKD
jgi:hypothetical protein